MNSLQAGAVRKVLFVKGSQPDRLFANLLTNNYLEGNRGDRYQIQQCIPTEALGICEREPQECILLDWELSVPNLDGDRAELLRQLDREEIPILILVSAANAQGVEDIAVDCEYADNREYLEKETLTKELLCLALRNAIAQAELKQKLNIAETRLHSYEFAEVTIEERDRHFSDILLPKYERILSATLDWVSLVDRNYMYRIVNQNYLDWFQKPWDEIVGHSVSDMVGEEVFQTSIKPNLDRCLAGEIVKYDIPIMRHQDGHQVSVSVTYTPYREVNGTISGVVANIRDISNRKQAEAELGESEQRFRNMADSAPMLIWEAGIDRSCHYFNKTWLDYSGRSLEQELGNGWLEGVHPDDLRFCTDIYTNAFDSRQEFEIEFRLRRANWSYGWVLNRGIPRFTSDGTFLGYIGSCVDISDRVQAEAELLQLNSELEFRIAERTEALRQSEAILQEAQAIAKLGSWELDLNTGVAMWSPELFRIFGLDPEQEEIAYVEAKEYWHPEDFEIFDRLIERAIQEGLPYEIDLRFTRADGTTGDMFAKGKPVFNTKGEVTRVHGVAMDISDRKLAEVQVRQQAEQQRLLNAITQDIHASLDLQEILNTTVAEIRQVLLANRVLVYRVFENGTGMAIAESVSPDYPAVLDNIHPEEVFPEETRAEYQQGKIYVLSDTESVTPCLIEFLKTMEVKAKLVIPIIQEKKLWGLLIAHQCDRPRQWQPWEIDLLQRLSNQLAIAIQQADLYEQLRQELRDRQQAEEIIRQQAERERLLREITQRIRQSLDLSTIFETATQEIRQFLLSDRVCIFQFDPDSHFNDGVFVAETVAVGFDSVLAKEFHDHCFGEQYSEAYHHGAFQAVDDIYHSGLLKCHTDILSVFQIRANLVIPLLNGNILWGLICIHQCSSARHWEQRDIELIQQISNQLAIAIQQASLYQQLQIELCDRQLAEAVIRQQAEREALLREITQHIRESLDLDWILTTAVNEVKRLLDCDRVLIFQLFDSGTSKVVKENVDPEYLSIVDTDWLDEHFDPQAFDHYINAQPRIVNDVFQDVWSECLADFMTLTGVKSKLVAPIVQKVQSLEKPKAGMPSNSRWRKDGSELWGLLVVHSCKAPREWQPAESNLLQQLANQLAIAIQQANLFQQVQTELTNKEKLYLQLTSELHQKSVLLKEVHHRVKNNLQVMSSLLRMQFRKATPDLKSLVEDYQNRIQSMALIHAQLHQNEDLAHINFHDYISDLTTNLFQCYGTNSEMIRYNLEVSDIFLPLDQSIPLGLIVNELISNTLKHAFPKGVGEVNVQLYPIGDRYHLIVSDNGVGIPADLDLENTDSLGMQLVYSLTDQLEAELTYTGTNGSHFLLNFPIL